MKIEDFIKIDFAADPLPETVRTKKTILDYESFKQKLKKNNKSIDEYIYNKYFTNNQEIVLAKNNYPYTFDEDVLHYVLWFNPNIENDVIDKIYLSKDIYYLVEGELKNNKELKFIKEKYNTFFIFENHVKAKSVLNVKHYQVLFFNKII